MTGHEAKAEALRTFMQGLTHSPSTGRTFSAGWEAATEHARPQAIATVGELREAFELTDWPRSGISVYDSGERLWIVWEDEDGDLWVASAPFEEDDFHLPALLEMASVAWPVSILLTPTGEPR